MSKEGEDQDEEDVETVRRSLLHETLDSAVAGLESHTLRLLKVLTQNTAVAEEGERTETEDASKVTLKTHDTGIGTPS